MLIASLYAHQPAAGPKRLKERKTERKQRRGSITFEYFERYKFSVFSFQDVFFTNVFHEFDEFHVKKNKKTSALLFPKC